MHCNSKGDQSRHRWLFAQENVLVETRAGIGGYLPRRMCWWRSGGEGREKEYVGSAETSKQSKPQMPPLINTRREADVYPDNLERKSQPKPERFTLHKTRDFLGDGAAGNGFFKFLLLITTSQSKPKETWSSY